MQNTPVKVFIIDPGYHRNLHLPAAFPGEDPATLPPPEHVAEACVTLAGVDSDEASATLIELGR